MVENTTLSSHAHFSCKPCHLPRLPLSGHFHSDQQIHNLNLDLPRATPDILWQRVGGHLDPRHRTENFNRTLVINPVRLGDAGDYTCMGSNKGDSGGTLESQPAKFKLIVNGKQLVCWLNIFLISFTFFSVKGH